MAAKSKYLNFPIEAADHRKLKLLCLHRDCTLKSILQEIVHSYVKNAPEFIAIQEIIKEYQRQKTNQRSRKGGSARKPQQYHAEAEVII